MARRLIDLTVEEVSIVDRPANLVKFTLIKRETPKQEDNAEVNAKLEEITNELKSVSRLLQDERPDGDK